MKKYTAFILSFVLLITPVLLSVSGYAENADYTVWEENGGKYVMVLPKTPLSEFVYDLLKNREIILFNRDLDEISPEQRAATGYTVGSLEGGLLDDSYTVIVSGDVNGDGLSNSSDARLALRCSAKLDSLTADSARAADINRDGKVLSYDARMILRMAAGLSVMSVEEYESSSKRDEEISASVSASLEQSRLDALKFDPLLKKTAPVDKSYFDDTVFVGDSVSMMLEYHDNRYGSFGNAKFLVRGSMSPMNVLYPVSSNSYHPKVNGVKVRVEDGVKMLGAKKVYIMLGMNEIGISLDKAVEDMTTLIDLIVQKNPGVTIVVQSVTPLANGSTSRSGKLNNDTIAAYNRRMRNICEQRKWYYLDVDTALKDSGGYLARQYCSDYPNMGLHVTYEAVDVWLDYIKTHPVPKTA